MRYNLLIKLNKGWNRVNTNTPIDVYIYRSVFVWKEVRKMRIILASGSPRRKELLKMITKNFEIIVSDVEEVVDEQLPLDEQVQEIAYLKGKAVNDITNGERVIISSDTMVIKNGKKYGKPTDRQNAVEMIKELLVGDRTHEVISGLVVIINKDGKYKEYKTFEKSKLFFKGISDEEIEKWVDTGKAMDKAGAYAMQEEFGVHIERIEGDYMTIVGLPVNKLYDILKNENII